ncbi:hypothetical protein LEP1GSC060_3410 [Leptospira weilii serovar Ranarum str. ICFT]|uniref:Uncharacterized protein n=1 Tax=Leptospira weilii serovar Ranarum str. ICFT TaxID=1218598 RepID=N1WI91_9LEPT|nr:hypothetical protein LEP1GSC060_3410 [Leptospira weilii serovar Ranarum str. ICFT]
MDVHAQHGRMVNSIFSVKNNLRILFDFQNRTTSSSIQE